MMEIDTALIRQLADLLHETDLSEIEVEDGDRRLRVARLAGATVVQAPAVATARDVAPPPAAEAAKAGANTITSPMVGTAYVAPEPGAAPFVKAGDQVVEGQTVMIVEAMKVMNPIRAPRDGVVAEVAVTDGQPVEYGEVLLTLE